MRRRKGFFSLVIGGGQGANPIKIAGRVIVITIDDDLGHVSGIEGVAKGNLGMNGALCAAEELNRACRDRSV